MLTELLVRLFTSFMASKQFRLNLAVSKKFQIPDNTDRILPFLNFEQMINDSQSRFLSSENCKHQSYLYQMISLEAFICIPRCSPEGIMRLSTLVLPVGYIDFCLRACFALSSRKWKLRNSDLPLGVVAPRRPFRSVSIVLHKSVICYLLQMRRI